MLSKQHFLVPTNLVAVKKLIAETFFDGLKVFSWKLSYLTLVKKFGSKVPRLFYGKELGWLLVLKKKVRLS